MTASETGSRRAGIAGLLTLVVVAAVGIVLLTGDETGQRIAAGVVMAGTVALGLLQGSRNRETLSLVGAAALLLGGAYGLFISIAGQDPFTDNVVLGLVVVGLIAGLFAPDESDSGEDDSGESDDESSSDEG